MPMPLSEFINNFGNTHINEESAMKRVGHLINGVVISSGDQFLMVERTNPCWVLRGGKCKSGPRPTVQNCLLRRSRPQDGKLAHLVFLVEVEKKIRPGATDGGGAEDCDIGRARRLAATPWSKKISKLTSDGVPHSVTDRKVIFSFEVGGDFLFEITG